MKVRCPHCQRKLRMRKDGCLPRHCKPGYRFVLCEGSGGFYVSLQP